MKKAYLALFGLPRPVPEHAGIVGVIRTASGGDFKQFPVPGGIAFMFMSDQRPWELSFDRILMNGDTMLITALDDVVQQGYGSAAGWINSHFPRR